MLGFNRELGGEQDLVDIGYAWSLPKNVPYYKHFLHDAPEVGACHRQAQEKTAQAEVSLTLRARTRALRGHRRPRPTDGDLHRRQREEADQPNHREERERLPRHHQDHIGAIAGHQHHRGGCSDVGLIGLLSPSLPQGDERLLIYSTLDSKKGRLQALKQAYPQLQDTKVLEIKDKKYGEPSEASTADASVVPSSPEADASPRTRDSIAARRGLVPLIFLSPSSSTRPTDRDGRVGLAQPGRTADKQVQPPSIHACVCAWRAS